MQNYKTTENRLLLAFVTKLEDIPGGIAVSSAALTQPTIKAGTPVGKDSNNLYHVLKTGVLTEAAANDDTEYKIAKGHNFKVGDHVAAATGAKAYAITAIDTTDPDEDTITLGTTLGVVLAEGAVIFHAAAESATTTSALKIEPIGLIGTTADVKRGGTTAVDCVVRGTVNTANIPPIPEAVKTKLPLIRFV